MKIFANFSSGFSRDLTQELESMKQLLKEIVNKITQNLIGKSPTQSSPERPNNDNSQSVDDRSVFVHPRALSLSLIRVNYRRDLLYVTTMI